MNLGFNVVFRRSGADNRGEVNFSTHIMNGRSCSSITFSLLFCASVCITGEAYDYISAYLLLKIGSGGRGRV
jgi:hypothetical protein